MSGELRINVPKLAADGSNWVVYRDRMTWAMDSRLLSDHLTNVSMPAAYGPGTINGVTLAARWAQGEATVKQAIAASVPDSIFNRIKGSTRAKDVWDALKALFEGRTQMIIVDLRRQLQTMKCGEDDNVRTHFDTIANLREQLAAMGKTIADDEYASILLGSLPAAYDATASAMSTTASLTNTTLTPNTVIRLVTDEYDRRALKKPKDGQDEVLGANAGGKNKNKNKGKGKSKKDVECFNCGNRGHYKSDCWAKGGGKEGQGPRRRGQDGAASADQQQPSQPQPDIGAWAAIEEVSKEEQDQQSFASELRTQSELYDSGASCHMSPFRQQFISFRPIPPHPILAADKRYFYAEGMGDLRIRVPNGESFTPIILRDTLYAPSMALTVVSISRIAKSGMTVAFEGSTCKITNKQGTVVGKIPTNNNGVEHVRVASASTDEVIDIRTLHRRLGHVAASTIRVLVRSQAIQGISLIDDGQPLYCESCEYAKATRKVIEKERQGAQASAFGIEIHTDLWTSPSPSLGGRKYYITFTDDYSRYTVTRLLKAKSEALQAYKDFAAWALTQHGAKIKQLHSDRGGEYMGEEFAQFLGTQGTERRATNHDTPQHNGVAESLNRRIGERIRAVLHHSGLPKSLWAEAVNHITWLKNRTSTRAIGNITPLEKLYGEKPDLARVPEWGQRVWVHTDSGSKLDARAIEGHWVGYDKDSTHAHRIYIPSKSSIAVERNVRFAPTNVTVHTGPAPTPTPAPPALPPSAPTLPPATPPAQAPAKPTPFNTPLPDSEDEEDGGEEVEGWEDEERPDPAPPGQYKTPAASKTTTRPKTSAPSYAQPTRTSTRRKQPGDIDRRIAAGEGTADGRTAGRKKKTGSAAALADELAYLGADCAFITELAPIVASAINDSRDDPSTLGEAQSRSDWPSWQQAMDREMKTLKDAGTWETVPRPTGRNIVGSKWVFRIKRKSDSSVDKYKARLVARGFTQVFGTDYFETYSPVANLTSFRTILALAAREDWDIDCFDFDGAYLNGELGESGMIHSSVPSPTSAFALATQTQAFSMHATKTIRLSLPSMWTIAPSPAALQSSYKTTSARLTHATPSLT